jgi:hypothetical protein
LIVILEKRADWVGACPIALASTDNDALFIEKLGSNTGVNVDRASV